MNLAVILFGAVIEIQCYNMDAGNAFAEEAHAPSGLSLLFQHYDLVICGGNYSITETSPEFNRILEVYQQIFLSPAQLPTFVQSFLSQRLSYGRTMLYLIPTSMTQLQGFVEQIGKLYRQLPTELYIDSRLRTFFLWPGPMSNASQGLLHDLARTFPLNSEVFLQFPDSSKFLEIYSVGNKTFVRLLPALCKRCSLQFPPLSSRRWNLEGTLVRATSFDHPFDQISTRYKRENGTLEFAGGLSVNVLWDLRDMLNMTIQAMAGDGYIQETAEGTLDGIGGQLQRGEADLAIPTSYFLNYRLKYLTPLFPLANDKILAFFIQPKASSARNIYSSPFSAETWIVYGFILLLLLLSSLFFSWAGSRLHSEPEWWSHEDVLWIISVICQKGWHRVPNSVSGKIVMFSTIFLSLLCFTAYSGAIISELAFESLPVNSARDLTDHEFSFIYDPQVYFSFFDSGSSDRSWHSEVLQVQSNPYSNDEEAFKKMMLGKTAFLTTSEVYCPVYQSLNLSDAYMCEKVSHVPFGKRALQNGFFVQKGSPFKELFNSKLLYLMQIGLNHRYWKIQFRSERVAVCLGKSTAYRENLGLEDVLTPFLILILGTVVSVMALGAEKCAYDFRQRQLFRKFYGLAF